MTEIEDIRPFHQELQDLQADAHRVIMLARSIDFILVSLDNNKDRAKEREALEVLAHLTYELNLNHLEDRVGFLLKRHESVKEVA